MRSSLDSLYATMYYPHNRIGSSKKAPSIQGAYLIKSKQLQTTILLSSSFEQSDVIYAGI